MNSFLIPVTLLALVAGGLNAPGPEGPRRPVPLEDLNDIKYTEEQLEWRNTPPELRAGVISPNEKWPGARVPYTISSSLPSAQRDLIPQAIQMIQNVTCVRFVPRTIEVNYVQIVNTNAGSCWSRLGYLGRGAQELNLGGRSDGSPCSRGSTAHEMMHTLGIEHEQNRPDRDDYITIDFSKIPKDWQSQYYKNDARNRSVYGQTYAYDSIMHYHLYSPDGQPTQVMFPKHNVDQSKIGQRNYLSKGDIALINAMYNCKLSEAE